MLVKDVIAVSRATFLNNLAIGRTVDSTGNAIPAGGDGSPEAVILQYVNLGVSELYRRFNLSIKSETVLINSDLNLYELRNEDVDLFLTLYDVNGHELQQTDVLGSLNYDFRQVNYKSFLLRKPFEGKLYAIYKASPETLTLNSKLGIPDAMLDALLTYVAYIGHSTINRDNINEASAYSHRFNNACAELEMQGYKIPVSNGTLSVQAKGFI